MAYRQFHRRLAALLVALLLAAGTVMPSFASSLACRDTDHGMAGTAVAASSHTDAGSHCDSCMKHGSVCAFCAMAACAVILPDIGSLVPASFIRFVATPAQAEFGAGRDPARDPYPPRSWQL